MSNKKLHQKKIECLGFVFQGAEMGLVDNSGRTPLHLVARHGSHVSLTNLLKNCQSPTKQVMTLISCQKTLCNAYI